MVILAMVFALPVQTVVVRVCASGVPTKVDGVLLSVVADLLGAFAHPPWVIAFAVLAIVVAIAVILIALTAFAIAIHQEADLAFPQSSILASINAVHFYVHGDANVTQRYFLFEPYYHHLRS